MDPEIELLIAVAEQMPMHPHIAELLQSVKERAAARSREMHPREPTAAAATSDPDPGDEQTSS